MKTDDMIKALVADKMPEPRSNGRPLLWLLGALFIVCLGELLLTLGVRPDIANALSSPRFLFKFVVTLSVLAITTLYLSELARPGASTLPGETFMYAIPVIILGGSLAEVWVIGPENFLTAIYGDNLYYCLTFIPLYGIVPLIGMLGFLRHNAPTQPMLAGAIAGLVAGSLSATAYALHCDNDSPLFVASWYSVAVLGLAVAGALGARWVVRW